MPSSTLYSSSLKETSALQEMDMAGYIHTELPLVGHDMEVKGSITSEDAGFYTIIISALIFLIATLSGHLA